MLFMWWLRPLSSAVRVGEQSAVVWNWLYRSPSLGQAIGRRHVDRPAEGARHAEAHVVDEDDQDVRRALGRLHLEARRRRGLAGVEFGVGG